MVAAILFAALGAMSSTAFLAPRRPPPAPRRTASPLAEAPSLLKDLAAYRPQREDIVALTHRLGEAEQTAKTWATFLMRRRRYGLLVDLLKRDRAAYVDTASWLCNVEGVPRDHMPNLVRVAAPVVVAAPAGDEPLVADCALPNATFADSPLDSFLLKVTRDFYAEETPGPAYRSERRGILGLMDEMRVLMFDEAGDAAAQTETVRLVLLDLMTPVLPPFYRLFMGGFVPSAARGDPAWLVDAFAKVPALGKPGERVLGLRRPPIYAPLLTSVVAPLVFGFLVGPGNVNRRADGELGGLVVEKCKFLQESNCKGLCLNQCKRPAELLFDDLGVPLHVVPNFETQECQWSWGVDAPDVGDDPDWPPGCLAGCPSRAEAKRIGRSS